MFLAGVIIYLFELLKRHFLPADVLHIEIINTICIVVASSLFSMSLFLTLHGLFTEVSRRGIYAMAALAFGSIILIMFLGFYFQYLYIARAINKIESAPNLFPEMVEQMSRDKNRGDAEKWAALAYKMYGVRMAYSNAANNQIYYVPSQDDTSFRRDIENMDLAVNNLRHVSFGLLYGAVDVVLSSFGTFLLGLCWATLRRLESASQISPDTEPIKA